MPIMSITNKQRLEEAVTEARRFLKFASIAFGRHAEDEGDFYSTREMGQVKRASLDLSQALVKFRKP